jgi:hypothetical protein
LPDRSGFYYATTTMPRYSSLCSLEKEVIDNKRVTLNDEAEAYKA